MEKGVYPQRILARAGLPVSIFPYIRFTFLFCGHPQPIRIEAFMARCPFLQSFLVVLASTFPIFSSFIPIAPQLWCNCPTVVGQWECRLKKQKQRVEKREVLWVCGRPEPFTAVFHCRNRRGCACFPLARIACGRSYPVFLFFIRSVAATLPHET